MKTIIGFISMCIVVVMLPIFFYGGLAVLWITSKPRRKFVALNPIRIDEDMGLPNLVSLPKTGQQEGGGNI